MNPFFLDTESRSRVDIDFGLDRYMPSAECLIASFVGEKGATQVWDRTADYRVPAQLEDALLDERVTLVAHNVQFDRTLLRVALGYDIPIERWFCTMACAFAHGLPGSLDALGPIVGIAADKQKLVDGKALIRLFCIPQRDGTFFDRLSHPVEWARFLQYAEQDTTALRELYNRLPKHNMQGEDLRAWHLDQTINERGFAIDRVMCERALVLRDQISKRLEAEISDLTDGAVTRGTQRERVLHHMVGEYGILMLDMTKDTVKQALKDPTLPADARRLLELRRDSSLSSLAKYERALERVGEDGRMRYTLQFSGAGRTGRWAGRGVQPHNMPRPKREADEILNGVVPGILTGTLPQLVDDVNQACSDALRSMIVAPEGFELLVGDWSNIEGRCVAWEANEEWKLQAFRDNDAGTGPDLYNVLYARLFNMKVENVQKPMRQKGKVFDLAFGYGGGVGACVTGASTYGVDLAELARVACEAASPAVYTKAEKAWELAFTTGADYLLEPETYIGCDIAKQMYRQISPKIAQLWYDVGRAVKHAIEYPGSIHEVAKCRVWRTPAWLIIELPSKRRLLYARPEIKLAVEVDEDTDEIVTRPAIRYMASKSGRWQRERTYGGKLVENITQAIANDVLRAALLAADAEGYPIVLHVHDELVAETPQGFFPLDDFLRLMERPLWWSDGLPLKAAGFVGTRYKKD